MAFLNTEPIGGISPLQDFRKKAVLPHALGFRTVQYATRVVSREDTSGWVVGRETTGDKLCYVLWPALPDKRVIPGWANAWPSRQDKLVPLLVTAGDGEQVGGGGPVNGGSGFVGPGGAIPPGLARPPTTTPGGGGQNLPTGKARPFVTVKVAPLKAAYLGDDRFGGQTTQMLGSFPVPHEGMLGIVLGATNEEKQHALWMPTDPRLVAVDHAGNPACASLVADLAPGDKIDETRTARLHSGFRVVVAPTGGVGFGNENILALSYGQATQDGVPGYGAIIGTGASGASGGGGAGGRPTTPGGTAPPGPGPQQPAGPAGDGGAAIAFMAQRPTCGPVELGAGHGDQHAFGIDADGRPLGSAHVSTSAFFFHNAQYDAPLEFQARDYPKTQDLPEKHKVHLVYDGAKFHRGVRGPARGLWRWYGEHTIGSGGGPPTPPTIPPPTTPPTIPPPTTPPVMPPPTTTPGSGTPLTPPGTGRDPPSPYIPGAIGTGGLGASGGGSNGSGPGGSPAGGFRGAAGAFGMGIDKGSLGPITPRFSGTGGVFFNNGLIGMGRGRPGGGGPATPGTATGPGMGPGGMFLPPPTETPDETWARYLRATGGDKLLALELWLGNIFRRAFGKGAHLETGGLDPRKVLGEFSFRPDAPAGAVAITPSGAKAGADRFPYSGVPGNPALVATTEAVVGSPQRTRPWDATKGAPEYEARTVVQTAFPTVLFRAPSLNRDHPNLRPAGSIPAGLSANAHALAPTTLRMEGFGAQRSTGEWAYTQKPGKGRYEGGTSNGGAWFLPPEVAIDDYATSFAPAGRTKSTTYVGFGPDVKLGFGFPVPSTGGMKTGYRMGTTSAGVWSMERMDSSGAASEVASFSASGAPSGFGIFDSPTITAAQITATQNDYAPTGYATARTIRVSADSLAHAIITGFAGGSTARSFLLVNHGSFDFTIAEEDAGSSAANRVANAGNDVTVPAGGICGFWYDGTISRWRPFANPVSTSVGAHASSHEDGGSDEIDVTALSGVLADFQKGTLIEVLTLSDGGASGTYTVPAACNLLIVLLVGGGGGGGSGAQPTTQSSGGGGGGAGGFAWVAFVPVDASYAWARGSGGGGGGAGGANSGTAGNDSTWDSGGGEEVIAKGGGGGGGQAAGTAAAGQEGGQGAVATFAGSAVAKILSGGAPGLPSFRSGAAFASSGAGGTAQFGGAGGKGRIATASAITGTDGIGPGAGGGGGAAAGTPGAGAAGGSGQNGLVKVWAYKTA